MGNLWASVINLCAQWCNVRNGCPAKLLINKQIFSPSQTHNDGVPCSNQGVATIFPLIRHKTLAYRFGLRRGFLKASSPCEILQNRLAGPTLVLTI